MPSTVTAEPGDSPRARQPVVPSPQSSDFAATARLVDDLHQRIANTTAERDAALARAAQAEAALASTRTRPVNTRPPSPVSPPDPAPSEEASTTTPPATAPQSVTDLLRANGFETPAQQFAEALSALSSVGLADKCLATLSTTKPDGLLRLLQDKVAWLCDRCAVNAPAPAIVRVQPADCDACGGSSVRAAAQRLVEACRARGFVRVLIVGGSPRAHVVVREAIEVLGLEVRCLDGTARQGLARASQQTAWCDVGFVWGASMLDHAVSNAYDSPKLHTVPIRGVTRFLEGAAAAISATRPADGAPGRGHGEVAP